MAFEPQNHLEAALAKAAVDPAARLNFYRYLFLSKLFIIQEGPLPTASGTRTLAAGDSLELRHMDWNGKSCLPVFSSLPRLQAVVTSEVGYLEIGAIELLRLTRGADLILNPGSDYGKELTKEEIARLLDGTMLKPSERHVVKTEEKVLLGHPKNYPQELVNALARYFKTNSSVKRAYIAHFHQPSRGEAAHTLIAIEASGNWDEIVAGAGLTSQGVPIPDPPIDYIQLRGSEGINGYFKSIKPFYEKKLFGIF